MKLIFMRRSIAIFLIISEVSCELHVWLPKFSGTQKIENVEIRTYTDVAGESPCHPSPCGPHTICTEKNGAGSCTCIPDYIGDPYAECKPECTVNMDCSSDNTFINDKSASLNTCQPSPCGHNSHCKILNNNPVCKCLDNYIGAPPNCRPECDLNSDCPQDKACIQQKCSDPCRGTCGKNAHCEVRKHTPICSCSPDSTGDPFIECIENKIVYHQNNNPCHPSPCGPNSQCKQINGQAVCSCVSGYIGSPPTCRPECKINTDCSQNEACINQKCRDPCPGTCGVRAKCNVINHNPKCTCPPGYTGDPFVRCEPIMEIPLGEPTGNPCLPSPCGPNSHCKVVNDQPSCSCLPDMIGNPPNCQSECVGNTECSSHLACINQICIDPCTGTCGLKTECKVTDHVPVCDCIVGYIGNPYNQCTRIEKDTSEDIMNPCYPNPCGVNAVCREQNGIGSCKCLDEYIGNPYEGCRPECTINANCPSNESCINQKCRDPCPGICGQNANCEVVSHLPSCVCNPGFRGNSFFKCTEIPVTPQPKGNPCEKHECGPNSQCRVLNETAICSCLSNYQGNPPNCRLKCLINSDCSKDKACIRNKCEDPCLGTCGNEAQCSVKNHNPICSCLPNYTGDPFTQCFKDKNHDPCFPNPCGINEICEEKGEFHTCTCEPGYIGDPSIGCKPECVVNSECSFNHSCIRKKCVDPCPGVCGTNAHCEVKYHTPVCSCLSGYTGDPFVKCDRFSFDMKNIFIKKLNRTKVCNPSPCGKNSICRIINRQPVCSCLSDHLGTPPNCRQKCVSNSDCSIQEICIHQKCANPCVNACGVDAKCEVIQHTPICSCDVGYTGDSFIKCNKIESTNDTSEDLCYSFSQRLRQSTSENTSNQTSSIQEYYNQDLPCVTLFCNLPKVLRKEDFQCVEPTTKINSTSFQNLLGKNTILMFDDSIDYSGKQYNITPFKKFHSYYWSKVLVTFVEGSDQLYQLIEVNKTEEKRNLADFSKRERIILLTPMFVTHLISSFCLIFTILLISCIGALRSNIFGKFWMIFSGVSIMNYGIVIISGVLYVNDHTFDTLDRQILFILYNYFELLVYCWLVVICMELFAKINAAHRNRKKDNKRLAFYLFGSVFGIFIFIIVHTTVDINVTERLYDATFIQRTSPKSVCHESTKDYMKVFGLPEIILKSITLLFSIGTAIIIWRSKRRLQKFEGCVHRSRKTTIQKFVNIMRRSILIFTVIGSLICNIVIYVIAIQHKTEEDCHSRFKWIEDINIYFEYLKRLNGFYITIYIFSGSQNFNILKNTFFTQLSSKSTESTTSTSLDSTFKDWPNLMMSINSSRTLQNVANIKPF